MRGKNANLNATAKNPVLCMTFRSVQLVSNVERCAADFFYCHLSSSPVSALRRVVRRLSLDSSIGIPIVKHDSNISERFFWGGFLRVLAKLELQGDAGIFLVDPNANLDDPQHFPVIA